MHCAYSNSDTIKLSFPDPKPPILKNRAYFSLESLVLNGVNVRGSLFVCFVRLDFLRPINNLSVKQGRVFLG